jgi:hypothetical protein
MMPISQLIDEWQKDRFLLGRLCRILQRLKALAERNHICVSSARLHEIGLRFDCPTEVDALLIGKALRLDVKLDWVAHTAMKTAQYESDGLIFKFTVACRRTVEYEDCILRYAARRSTSGWRRCKLMFHDYELVAHNFPVDGERWSQNMQERIKKQLWSLVLTYSSQGRFPNYDFNSPF